MNTFHVRFLVGRQTEPDRSQEALHCVKSVLVTKYGVQPGSLSLCGA
ncbi:hypothetical protein O9992_03710 [Vibrio lentus]|nr:hypothetical protein [Vibrio lentus]